MEIGDNGILNVALGISLEFKYGELCEEYREWSFKNFTDKYKWFTGHFATLPPERVEEDFARHRPYFKRICTCSNCDKYRQRNNGYASYGFSEWMHTFHKYSVDWRYLEKAYSLYNNPYSNREFCMEKVKHAWNYRKNVIRTVNAMNLPEDVIRIIIKFRFWPRSCWHDNRRKKNCRGCQANFRQFHKEWTRPALKDIPHQEKEEDEEEIGCCVM
jgi:hypothetical protein